MNFTYTDFNVVNIIASNGKQATYNLKLHKEGGLKRYTLAHVKITGAPKTQLGYKKKIKKGVGNKQTMLHLLNSMKQENGGGLSVNYHDNKVSKLFLHNADRGTSRLYDIEYNTNKGKTVAKDVCGGTTVYRYNPYSQLIELEKRFKGKPYSKQVFFWGKSEKYYQFGKPLKGNEGNLTTKCIADANGNIQALTHYEYDQFGNILKETVAGALTGNTESKAISIDKHGKPCLSSTETYCRHFTYSEDGFNLPLTITEENGAKTIFSYSDHSDRVESKLISINDNIQQRTFYEYDTFKILVKQINDDGSSDDPNEITNVNKRLITVITPNYSEGTYGFGKPSCVINRYWDRQEKREKQLERVTYTYGLYDLVTCEDHYDANDEYRYSISYQYDAEGNCTEKVDAIGRVTQYSYDQQNNCILEKIQGTGLTTEHVYDIRNRIIKTVESHDSGECFVSSFRYDMMDRKIAEIDSFGRETRYQYDSMGRLIEVKLPTYTRDDGKTITPTIAKQYNIWDQIVKETDTSGSATKKSYNSKGQLTEVIYSDGSSEQCRYRKDGLLLKKTEKNGTYALLSYDDMNRLIHEETYSSTDQLLRTVAFEYDRSQLVRKIDPMGFVTEYVYDGVGRKVTEIQHSDDVSYREEYGYDPMGRLYKIKKWFDSGPDDYTAYIKKFDELDRIIEERTEDSTGQIFSRKTYAYDINGNRVEEIDYQNEQSLSIQYSKYTSYHLPSITVDPSGNETHYVYDFTYRDAHGQQVLKTIITDPNGVQCITVKDAYGHDVLIEKRNSFGTCLSLERIRYDERGLKSCQTTTVMDNGVVLRDFSVIWKYDSMGRPLTITEDPTGKNKQVNITYTDFGTIQTKTKPDGVILTYTYDSLARETTMESSDGTIFYAYTYDLNDHLIESKNLNTGDTLTRVFDPFGNLIEEALPDGQRVLLEHDGLKRIKRLEYPDGSYVTYHYDAVEMKSVSRYDSRGTVLYTHTYDETDWFGRSKTSTLISGDQVNFEWDIMGRFTTIESPHSLQKVPENGYDSVGNLHRIHCKGNWGEDQEQYHYDELNQLIYEDSVHQHRYKNDSLHNRLQKDQLPYSINTLNQIECDGAATYQNDRNGNLLAKCNEEGCVNYTYDALNRLTSVYKEREWMVECAYDSYGRRISTKEYRWNQGWAEYEQNHFLYQGLHEIGSIGSDGEIKQLRVLGKKEGTVFRVAVAVELNQQVYAPLYDHRFNLIALVDKETARPVETYRYTAFGEMGIFDADGRVIDSSSVGNPWLFGNKRYDTLTQLYNFGKRYYAPSMGRWISPDPGDFVDGLNLYAYTHNNPIINTDFYGFHSTSVSNNKGVMAHYGGLPGNLPGDMSRQLGRCIELYCHHAAVVPALQYLGEGFGRVLQDKPFHHTYASDLGTVMGKVGEKSMSNKLVRVFFGILTNEEDAIANATYLSNKFDGSEVHYSCRVTKGAARDILNAGVEYFDFGKQSLKEINETIVNDYHKMKAINGENFALYYPLHSRGALDFYQATLDLPVEVRSKINVYTLGAARFIPRSNWQSSVNYVNPKDGVVKIGKVMRLVSTYASPVRSTKELFFDKTDVVYTTHATSRFGACVRDHMFQNYDDALKAIVDKVGG